MIYTFSSFLHPLFCLSLVQILNPVSPTFIAVINMKNLFSLPAIKGLSDTRQEKKERGSENRISSTAWLLFLEKIRENSAYACVIFCVTPCVCVCGSRESNLLILATSSFTCYCDYTLYITHVHMHTLKSNKHISLLTFQTHKFMEMSQAYWVRLYVHVCMCVA